MHVECLTGSEWVRGGVEDGLAGWMGVGSFVFAFRESDVSRRCATRRAHATMTHTPLLQPPPGLLRNGRSKPGTLPPNARTGRP